MRTKEIQITNRSIASKSLRVFFQVWVCVTFLCGTSLAQEKFTNSIVPSSFFADSAPIRILQLKHGERALKFGDELINNDPLDLVSSLSISVVNTSNLAISDVDIDVQMPVSGGEIKHLVIPISLMGAGGCFTHSNTEPLGPEGVITTQTRDRVSVKIPESLGKLGYRFGSGSIEIRIGTVKFVDGTAWRNGFYLKRSDESPNVWRVSNLSERSRLTGIDSKSKEGREKEPDSRSLLHSKAIHWVHRQNPVRMVHE